MQQVEQGTKYSQHIHWDDIQRWWPTTPDITTSEGDAATSRRGGHLCVDAFCWTITNTGQIAVAAVTHTTIQGWKLPGGHYEGQRQPEAEARRELAEETGLVIAHPSPTQHVDGIEAGGDTPIAVYRAPTIGPDAKCGTLNHWVAVYGYPLDSRAEETLTPEAGRRAEWRTSIDEDDRILDWAWLFAQARTRAERTLQVT